MYPPPAYPSPTPPLPTSPFPMSTHPKSNLSATFALVIGIIAVLPTLVTLGLDAYLYGVIATRTYTTPAILRLFNTLDFLVVVVALILGIVALILGFVGWNTARQSGQGRVSSAIGLTLGTVVLVEKGSTLVYLLYLLALHRISLF